MQSIVPTTGGKDKAKYKVKNRSQYNKSRQRRGSLSLWLDDSVFRTWEHVDLSKKVVGERAYPDCIIYCVQVLRIQYRQPPPAYLGQRNESVAAIGQIGRRVWKTTGSGYHLRSRSEATMYQYKTIVGGSLRAREYVQRKGRSKAEVCHVESVPDIGHADIGQSRLNSKRAALKTTYANPPLQQRHFKPVSLYQQPLHTSAGRSTCR